jgi:hypothetical protein
MAHIFAANALPSIAAAQNAVAVSNEISLTVTATATALFLAIASTSPAMNTDDITKAMGDAVPDGVKVGAFKSARSHCAYVFTPAKLFELRAIFGGDGSALTPAKFAAAMDKAIAHVGNVRAAYDAGKRAEKDAAKAAKAVADAAALEAAKALEAEREGTLAEPVPVPVDHVANGAAAIQGLYDAADGAGLAELFALLQTAIGALQAEIDAVTPQELAA